jgi:cytoskeletal protein CcmA (bactofilin family)
MFSKNKDKGTHSSSVADKVSIIAAGMQIHGDVESEGDIRIDGKVHGNIFCKSKVVIISSGTVEGDIEAVNVDIHGTVNGNITAHELLSLKAKSNITGNLTTEKLQIEPNATFNGLCTMSFQPKPTSVNEIGLLFQEN